jgi:hypothetical protein
MKNLQIGICALAIAIGAGALSLHPALAAPLNCAFAPYCPTAVVVPPSDEEAAVNGSHTRYEIIIDVDQPLPPSVTFPSSHGAVITLVRRQKEQTADVSTIADTTDGQSTPLLNASTAAGSAPSGFDIVTQYHVARSGDGTVVVVHAVRESNSTPYKEGIPIHVQ